MLELSFNKGKKYPYKILCLGAHCDDIEIGCGATLFDIAQRYSDIRIHVLIFCSDDLRESESRRSFEHLLGKNTNVTFEFAGFRDGYLPYQAAEVKEFFLNYVSNINPELVITHCRADLHQDHKFIGDVTYQVFRDHLILEMEIPKYDGDIGRPNIYTKISRVAAETKVACLINYYESQKDKDWFSEETFLSLMRLRGIECRSSTGLAEAFYVSKMVLV